MTAALILMVLFFPILLVGIIQRTKAFWSGRKGPPIAQLAFDLWRLFRKRPVYSSVTTPIFRFAPYVALATALATASLVPLLGRRSLVSFPFDFVWFAYIWALGRTFRVLAALDTGSSIEGLGASREATFSALLEPAFFLVIGALSLATGHHALADTLALRLSSSAEYVVWFTCLVALLVVVQVESGRMPVDDPTTHLELTMVHEVMALDHSGPDLAVLQYAAALKLTVGVSLIATLLNPWVVVGNVWLAGIANLSLCCILSVAIGTIESLIARLKLRTIPEYIFTAILAGFIALLATSWRAGGLS